MTEHRYEAHADIIDADRIVLMLTDSGPITVPDSAHEQPDVICSLRPSQARALAHRLTWLAGHTDQGGAGR